MYYNKNVSAQGPYGEVSASVSATASSGPVAPAYSTSAISAQAYSDVCGTQHPTQMVRIPVVKHIVHNRPVTYQHVTKEITYMDMPIQQNFEQRMYPANNVAQCAAPAAAPCAPRNNCC